MDVLSKIEPDKTGEIQLTEAIDIYLKKFENVLGFNMKGRLYDCGDKLGYLIANIEFSKKDLEIKVDLLNYLRKNN